VLRDLARFDLLAAIDLRGGRVVRLREGDFERETAYSDDPVAVAAALVERGVRWLHVVDLDGARAGEPVHEGVIDQILEAVGSNADVEVAGGLRTPEAVDRVIAQGARRAVVGSAALADPAFAAGLVDRHGPDRVAVALDVRGGQAVGDAWRVGGAAIAVDAALEQLAAAGVQWFEVTSIDRDGSLAGPDLDLLQSIVARAGGRRVIASGGIQSVEDMLATWTIGCAGAIVGRAIYEETFNLEQAVRATRGSG
jgi:phosphoribosylformimino-5-aminoimidazole carboxamide ribotide isomerase